MRDTELIFVHNGGKRFSISNPETEDTDSDNGKLGDINAITSIGNSSKTDASNKIGKFGVGFKAVFQYTSAPAIYDPDIFFKIERFIVPIEIKDDFEGRGKNETLFVFPFDHKTVTADKAFADISEKLCSLVFPVLFLTNLKEVSFKYGSVNGGYTKSVEKERAFDNATARLITFTQNDGKENRNVKLWLFTRTDEKNYTYSVGFFLNDDGLLSPENHIAFCFFPTKEVTRLQFIVHAPFLLTDSREGIKAGVPHNKDMISQLAELAADCLVYLRDICQDIGEKLINDDTSAIIPYDESVFNDVDDKNKISFKPFYTAIKETFGREALLPGSDGYVKKENAYWAAVPKITEVISNEQLASLTDDLNAKWIFTSFGRESISSKNKALMSYIDSNIHAWLNEEDLIKGWSYENGTAVKSVCGTFLESQPFEWMHVFYKWISETDGRTKLIKNESIFLNQNGKAVPALSADGKAILFLFDVTVHFKKFFMYYKKCPDGERDGYINLIKDCPFIRCRSTADDKVYHGKASELYLPTEEFRLWFEDNPATRFVDSDYYTELVGKDDKKSLLEFLTKLGVKDKLSLDEIGKISTQYKTGVKINGLMCLGGVGINTILHFKKFFMYYKKCLKTMKKSMTTSTL